MKTAATHNTFYETYPEESNEGIKLIVTFLSVIISPMLAKRVIALTLLFVGMPLSQIAELTGLSLRSVNNLQSKLMRARKFKNELRYMILTKRAARKRVLNDIKDELLKEIETHEYFNLQQILDMIEKKWEIKVSHQTLSRFLKANGIKKLQMGSIPAKADTAKQRAFYDNVMSPLMDEVKEPESNHVLLYLDASHFVMGCDFLGAIWGTVRRYRKTGSGRKRYNVLGAIDFATKQVFTVTNDSYITATQVMEMLDKIAAAYPEKTIHVVLDNARYQKCADVKKKAEELGIELVYIPPYSPNLNLIERLWKFVKKQLRTQYYDSFDKFSAAIDNIINETQKSYYEQICSLINEKVQLFDDLALSDDGQYIAA